MSGELSTGTTEGRLDFSSRPAPARVWDYLAGSKDNFAVDRDVADAMLTLVPNLAVMARETCYLVARAVRLLATEGVDQFLDVGCGFPAWTFATHHVAQLINRSARVVYVDHDPLVAVHGRALLTSNTREGRSEFVEADLREPDTILNSPILRNTLDLTRPVALVLSGVLHDVPDTDKPHQAVDHLVQALPPGSHVVLSHMTADGLPPGDGKQLTKLAAATGYGPLYPRSRDEIARFLDGLDILKPGLVPVGQWRPDLSPSSTLSDAMCYAAVGRIP